MGEKTQGNEQKNRDIFKKQALKLYKNTEKIIRQNLR